MTEHLEPVAGRKVRTPEGGVLPPEGAAVEMTPFWRRRLKEGDVTIKARPVAGAKKKEA